MIAPGIEAANELFRFLRLLAFLFFSLELILLDPILHDRQIVSNQDLNTYRRDLLCRESLNQSISAINPTLTY